MMIDSCRAITNIYLAPYSSHSRCLVPLVWTPPPPPSNWRLIEGNYMAQIPSLEEDEDHDDDDLWAHLINGSF